MSAANVLTPSAPPDPLYPQLPDFRMQKVNKILADLNGEVSKYRTVAKKYKRAKKFVNWSAASSSSPVLTFSTISSSTLVVYTLIILDTLQVKISTKHESEQTLGNKLYPYGFHFLA